MRETEYISKKMLKEHRSKSGSAIDSNGHNGDTTPICRCRVIYLGSSVPHATKDGLQGIQEPLKDLYPENGFNEYSTPGIDSWISVWSNGILIENVDDSGREIKRFFPIESLHYCAAVRYVIIPSILTQNNDYTDKSSAINGQSAPDKIAKFLPLDSPFLRTTNAADLSHPPLFACILRRTTGIKVLECHAFVCKRETAANALVRCCFHAYADSMYAKQIDESPYAQIQSTSGGSKSRSNSGNTSGTDMPDTSKVNGRQSTTPSDRRSIDGGGDDDETYKVWNGNNNHGNNNHGNNNGGETGNYTEPKPTSSVPQVLPPGMPIGIMQQPPTGTLRTHKHRQIMVPNMSLLPPPPMAPSSLIGIPYEAIDKNLFKQSLKKTKKSKKSLKNMPPNLIISGPPTSAHGQPILTPNGYINYINHGPYHMPPPSAIYGHPPPPPPSAAYSMSRRLRRVPQSMMAGNGPQGPPPEMMIYGDEPVYIPAMRPLTPLSNYHGYHTNGDAIYQIQYGTTPRRPMEQPPTSKPGKERTKNDRNRSKSAAPVPVVTSPAAVAETSDSSERDERNNSPSINGGLYRRKERLNERAFSYSIRQEHRSRSNSLANLQFENDVNERRYSNGDVNGRVPASVKYVNGSGPQLGHHRTADDLRYVTSNGNDIHQLSQSVINLSLSNHHNGHMLNGNSGKTASINRSKTSRQQLKAMPVSPPVPPPMPLHINNSGDKSRRK